MKQIKKNILFLTLMSTGCSPLVGMNFLQKAKDTVIEQVKKHPYVYGSIALGATAYGIYATWFKLPSPYQPDYIFSKAILTLAPEEILQIHTQAFHAIADIMQKKSCKTLPETIDFILQSYNNEAPEYYLAKNFLTLNKACDYCLDIKEIKSLVLNFDPSKDDVSDFKKKLNACTFENNSVGFYDIFNHYSLMPQPNFDWQKPTTLAKGKNLSIALATNKNHFIISPDIDKFSPIPDQNNNMVNHIYTNDLQLQPNISIKGFAKTYVCGSHQRNQKGPNYEFITMNFKSPCIKYLIEVNENMYLGESILDDNEMGNTYPSYIKKSIDHNLKTHKLKEKHSFTQTICYGEKSTSILHCVRYPDVVLDSATMQYAIAILTNPTKKAPEQIFIHLYDLKKNLCTDLTDTLKEHDILLKDISNGEFTMRPSIFFTASNESLLIHTRDAETQQQKIVAFKNNKTPKEQLVYLQKQLRKLN